MSKVRRSRKLDALDRRILAHLIVNSNRPIVALAEHLEINPETLRYRIERLKRRKILKRFIAYIDTSRLGYSNLLVFFRVHGRDAKKLRHFFNNLVNNNYITYVAETIGKWDGICELTVKNFNEAIEIIESMKDRLDLNSLEYEIQLERKMYTMRARIFEEAYEYSKPLEINRYPSDQVLDIDEKDFQILSILSTRGDITLKELAETIGVSINTVKNRIERLESLGIIRGYSVTIDEATLGFNRVTLLLKLLEVPKTRISKFLEEILSQKNVLNVIECFGAYDLVIDIYAEEFRTIVALLKKLNRKYPDVFSFYDLILVVEELKREYLPSITIKKS